MGRVVRVSACALVESVLVAEMWKMDALKARWSWAEICSTFPRCLCHGRRGVGLKEETPFGDTWEEDLLCCTNGQGENVSDTSP